MTASAKDKLITLENLRCCWGSFWKKSAKQRCSGVDNVTPEKFQQNAEINLSQIVNQLHQGYRFSPLRGYPIPKKDGKSLRIICIPTVQDRIVQLLIGEHLTERADVLGITNEVSFGFMRRRGVRAARDRAIALRNDYPWAYKSDISSFFDRIPREELVTKTIHLLRTRSLRALLLGAASCEIEETRAVARIARSNGIERGLGVRQGMPLSPIFANIILRDFDREIIRLNKKMVRYADDFIIFANSHRECLQIDSLVRDILKKIGFQLPPLSEDGKTQISPPHEEIEFLGLALSPTGDRSYELLLTEVQIQKINRHMRQLTDINQLLNENIDITKLSQKIDNKVGGYFAAYSDAQNISKLEDILRNVRTDILTTVYEKAFGEERVKALDAKMRSFLCLE